MPSASATYLGKLAVGGFLLVLFETSIAKMRVFRVPDFLGIALMLGLLGTLLLLRVAELLMNGASLDIAHMLAGGLVLVSFMLLYQDRMFALLNVFALHAVVLSAVGRLAGAHPECAASLRSRRLIALVLKGRSSSRWRCGGCRVRLGIHRTIETVVGIGPTMLAGMGARCALDGGHAQGQRRRPIR